MILLTESGISASVLVELVVDPPALSAGNQCGMNRGMYYLAIALLGIVCLFNVLTIVGKNSASIGSWIAPLLFFFILIVHVLVPGIKYAADYYRWRNGYPDEIAIMAVIWLILAALVLTVALNMALKRIKPQQLPVLPVSRNFDRFILVTYMAGMAFALFDLQTISQMGGVEVYLTDRIGSGEERGIGRMLGFFMATAIVSYAYVNCRVLTPKRLFILAAMCAFPLYYYTALTSRNSVFFILLLVIVVMLLARSMPLTINKRTVGAIIGIAAVALIGGELVAEATETRLRGRAPVEGALLRAADGAFGNDEALLYRSMMRSPELALGKTYLAASVAFVPRSVWPDKPTGGGPFLVNLIYPGKYVVGAEGNTSYTTGLFVEGVLNFGLLGYFLAPLGLVAALAAFARNALNARTVETQLIWIITTLTCSTAIVYMELLGFIARVGVMLFPLLAWQALQAIIHRPHPRRS